MTSTKKTLLGIASFIPFVLGIVLMVVYMMAISKLMLNIDFTSQQPDPAIFFRLYLDIFKSVLIVFIPLFIVSITLKIIYIILAVNNKNITEVERIIWIFGFLLFGSIGYPIYFFLRIYGVNREA